MTQLWSATCHMGSHSVTCYPTQVNTPRLNPSHAGRYSIYLPQRDGRLSWNQRPFDHQSDAQPLHHQDKGARIEVPQTPRLRSREYMGMWYGEGCSPPGVWEGAALFFSFLVLKSVLRVHSLVNMSVFFCTVVRPGPDLHYACPV